MGLELNKKEGIKMYRGTTPTLHLTLSGIQVDTLKELYLTFHQKSGEWTLRNDRMEFDTENNKIKVKLTERETLTFNNEPVSIQLRATTLDGNVIATSKYSVSVNDVYYEEIIGDE